MPARRPAYLALIIVLVLLVVAPAAVDAGGNGTSADRGTDASSAENPGAPAVPTATPSVQTPASADGQAKIRAPVAVTASLAKAAVTAMPAIPVTTTMRESAGTQQSGSSRGNGEPAGQAEIQPTIKPSAAPTTAGGARAGGDGSWKTDGGNASASGPAPTSVTTIAAGSTQARTGPDGAGKGSPVGGTVTATPTGEMKAASTPTSAPAGTVAAPAGNGSGAPRAAQTMSLAGVDTRGAVIGSPSAGGTGAGQIPSGPIGSFADADASFSGNSTACGPGSGAGGAPTSTIAARPTAEGAGHATTTVTYAAGNGSGVQAHRTESPGSRGTGSPAGRDETASTVKPSSEGIHAFRVGAAPETARAPRPGGAGQDGTHGGPRPQNAGRERGPPDPPAAAPVRTGLEPVDRSKDESGRGRRGVPAFPLPVASEVDTPDPLLFLRFLLFLGYRRLRPGNLLDHPLRQSLYAAIRADPGLDLAGCVAATAANRETLRYHLALLVCGGKVLEETRNGSVRYFPHDLALSPVRRAVIHLDRSPGLAPALHHIRDTPGIPRRELAARLGVAGPTVTRQVQRLVDEGLVENRGSGLSQGYWLTPECADALGAIAEAERNRVVRGVDAVTA
ncbi:MAG: winged helix-turn-helix transcriptional regulator [Methanospirillum sp.]